VSGHTTKLLQCLLRLTLTVHGQKIIPKLDTVNDIFLRLLQVDRQLMLMFSVNVNVFGGGVRYLILTCVS
jgi:hypothetical protein